MVRLAITPTRYQVLSRCSIVSNQRAGRPTNLRHLGPKRLMAVATGTKSDKQVQKIFQDLQQGSDVRGIAMEGIPDEPITLTPIRIFFVSVGFAKWLSSRLNKPIDQLRISIGRDPRITGKIDAFFAIQEMDLVQGGLVKASVTAGLASKGVEVTDFALASTPAMFMSCITDGYNFDGALMLTASHLPFNRNGIKFFEAKGGLDKPDIKEILRLAVEECTQSTTDISKTTLVSFERIDLIDDDVSAQQYLLDAALKVDPTLIKEAAFMPVYAAHLRSIIKASIGTNEESPLKGFKIAVDAGNGAGGFVASDVLAPLGADVSGSQFLDPDGTFPNHIPNPEDSEAAASATEATIRSGSDLGIIYDTDVDRSGVVDKTGVSINSNRMIALMSAIVLKEHPGTTIVTDSVTSNGLRDFIQSLGGKHFRYKRGYKNVIGKGVELNEQGIDCQLMMETSGHGALKENYFLDDGAYMSLKIVVEMVRRQRSGEGSIGDLIQSLPEPLEAKEYRIRINDPNFKEVALEATQRFHDFVESGAIERWRLEEENYEGWRVEVDEGEGKRGWCLLRPSIHDPLCVLNIESEIENGLDKTKSEILQFFETCKDLNLDLSPLK